MSRAIRFVLSICLIAFCLPSCFGDAYDGKPKIGIFRTRVCRNASAWVGHENIVVQVNQAAKSRPLQHASRRFDRDEAPCLHT
jgi:hypothetical protein